jgi:hypothetical protein
MRVVLLTFATGAVALALFGSQLHSIRNWPLWLGKRPAPYNLHDTVRSTAYVISGRRWLEFELPANATALRILTNAAVTDTRLAAPNSAQLRPGWRYRIAYELIRRDTATVTREYHLRSSIRQDAADDLNDPVEGDDHITWFASSDRSPTQTRTIQLPLGHFKSKPHSLRLRLAQADAEIQQVVVRVYMKYERWNYADAYTWSRLSVEQRARLARASVYPPDLLGVAERRNLLQWNWAAVPPRGTPGADYQRLQIYQREAPRLRRQSHSPPEGSLTCEPLTPLTVAVPSVPGLVSLVFSPAGQVDKSTSAQVEVLLHQAPLGSVTRHESRVGAQAATVQLETDKGSLLEIVSDQLVYCVAHWRPRPGRDGPRDGVPDTPLPLTGTAEVIQAYVIDDQAALQYTIAHVGTMATPLHVALRCVIEYPFGQEPAVPVGQVEPRTVNYELLDRNDRVIKSGQLATNGAPARYDRARVGSAPRLVTEPTVAYFAVPAHVARMRFTSTANDVCVIAFTQPPDVARVFELPVDPLRLEQSPRRSWFLLRPDNHENLLDQNRYATITTQARPPAANELLLSGDYTWEDFRPVGLGLGRFILTKRDDTLPLRAESLPNVYCEVPVNQDCSIQWQCDSQTRAAAGESPWSLSGDSAPTARRLLYVGDDSIAAPIRVMAADRTWFEFTPRARRGEVELPVLAGAAPRQQIRIETRAPVRCFLRGATSADGPLFVKRFAYDAGLAPLTFHVLKESAEPQTLILRPFFAVDDSQDAAAGMASDPTARRRTVKATIDNLESRGPGPWRSWTIARRRFDITPSYQDPAVALDASSLRLDQGVPCAIVLGEDLPPGRYQITVRAEGESAGDVFVSLYCIRPGPPSYRKLDSRLAQGAN